GKAEPLLDPNARKRPGKAEPLLDPNARLDLARGERVEARAVVPEDLRLRLRAHAFERDELVDGLGEQSVGVWVVGRDDDVVVTDRLHHLPEHPLVGVGGDVALPVEVLAREPADLHLGTGAELLPRFVQTPEPPGQPAARALEKRAAQARVTLEHAAGGHAREDRK